MENQKLNNKNLKNWILPGIVILGLLFFFEFYTQPNHPSFFEDIIDELTNDKKLMDSIGGYQSFEYSYNKKELNKDTLGFSIIILGNEKKLICKGQAAKGPQQDWIVLKKDTMVKD